MMSMLGFIFYFSCGCLCNYSPLFQVGEYIVFHVQSNFYVESFDYIVMSKGIILHSSQEIMTNNIRTFAVTLSAEMAPAATVVVYTLARHGDIIADSLTFPVNGISRNNVSGWSPWLDFQQYLPPEYCLHLSNLASNSFWSKFLIKKKLKKLILINNHYWFLRKMEKNVLNMKQLLC